ncbi:helix-turn-helix domain-containing protein, partial [[Lactobacillus] rogosae]
MLKAYKYRIYPNSE